MRPSRKDLTAGEWALLGLLDHQPAHGFALARAMAPGGEVGRVWSVRRAMVYRALETLERMGLVRPMATQRSEAGPQRTIMEPTEEGIRAFTEWLGEPVDRVRDTRSMLMLKILFLTRRNGDLTTLLNDQRDVFAAQADRLASAAGEADGFDRSLLLWRLHSTRAVIDFTEALLAAPPSA